MSSACSGGIAGARLLAGMGTGIMVFLEQEYDRLPERDRERERAETYLSKAPWDSAALSMPSTISSEKHKNAASPTNLKPCSELISRYRLSFKEAAT